MRIRTTTLAVLLACAGATCVRADPPADVMQIVREGDIKWTPSRLIPRP